MNEYSNRTKWSNEQLVAAFAWQSYANRGVQDVIIKEKQRQALLERMQPEAVKPEAGKEGNPPDYVVKIDDGYAIYRFELNGTTRYSIDNLISLITNNTELRVVEEGIIYPYRRAQPEPGARSMTQTITAMPIKNIKPWMCDSEDKAIQSAAEYDFMKSEQETEAVRKQKELYGEFYEPDTVEAPKEDELLPCPFCGGKAEFDISGLSGSLYRIMCNNTDICESIPATSWYSHKNSAIKAWNTRSPSPSAAHTAIEKAYNIASAQAGIAREMLREIYMKSTELVPQVLAAHAIAEIEALDPVKET